MLRMSWMKSESTGELRARWIHTAAPSLLARTSHALGEISPSQMSGPDQPRAGIAGKAIAARDGRAEEADLVKVTVF